MRPSAGPSIRTPCDTRPAKGRAGYQAAGDENMWEMHQDPDSAEVLPAERQASQCAAISTEATDSNSSPTFSQMITKAPSLASYAATALSANRLE